MAGTLGFSLSVASFCSSVNTGQSSVPLAAPNQRSQRRVGSVSDYCASTSGEFLPGFASRPAKRFPLFEVHATLAQAQAPKWWERNAGPNMIDIHSTQEFLDALSQAGDRLVIVEFYATWCASCKALFPKLCRTAQEHREILFLKVNFDENKPMCKNLNVRVLPYFHFYRGSDGQLESFTCSLAKFQKVRDAIELHNTARCSIGPPLLTAEHLKLEPLLVGKDLPAASSSSSSSSSL